MTARSIRTKSQKSHGADFTLKHIDAKKLFGVQTVWRDHSKVLVSDLERTIVDMLDDPSIGGGIQQVADCLSEYLRRPDRNDAQLLAYADRLGNGAVFKRLGFLVEQEATAAHLVEACRTQLTKGNVKLDPSLECPKLVTRWRLRIPAYWKARTRA
jgi:predicted transcriptional regulator of viral defense system